MDRTAMLLGGLALSVGLSVGMIGSARVVTEGLVAIKSQDQTITVTGSAKRRLRSDLVIWRSIVTQRAPDVATAYKQLARQVPQVTAYLQKKGVPPSEIIVSSVSTQKVLGRDKEGRELPNVILSYELEQTVEIRSGAVDKIEKIAREATELINDGILLESAEPQYLYTKLGELKIQMLAEAAKDAKVRAEQIAASTGSRIGKLRSARMGVMQVNAADASEISDTGVNDTASLEKDIMAVVQSSFSLD
ncbi:MAG: SIMPL domain-containing protein [Polyangia bacterium]